MNGQQNSKISQNLPLCANRGDTSGCLHLGSTQIKALDQPLYIASLEYETL